MVQVSILMHRSLLIVCQRGSYPDVILKYEDYDDISNLNDEGREEVRQRWAPFLEMLPEYENVCEDILNENSNSHIE